MNDCKAELRNYELIIEQYQKENKFLWIYSIVATLVIVLLIIL